MNVVKLSQRQTIHFDAPNTSSSESSLDDVLPSNSSIMLSLNDLKAIMTGSIKKIFHV